MDQFVTFRKQVYTEKGSEIYVSENVSNNILETLLP